MNNVAGIVRLPVGNCTELSMQFKIGENWYLEDYNACLRECQDNDRW